MTSQEAVLTVTDFVRETGKTATEAVKELWPKLQPIEDVEHLVQFALAAMVSYEYKHPPREEVLNRTGHEITIHYKRHRSKEYTVSVQLLHDVRYNINGRVKAIAMCNRHDMLTLARSARAAEQGFARYGQTWEYVAQRLQETKKDKVEHMGHGEQQKIARMVHDLQNLRIPADLPSKNLKALA